MPRVVDLTLPLGPETRVFPGYPRPVVHKWSTISEDGYYANFLFLVEHTGTHMDSPAHFVPGAPTIDQIPPERFTARAVVLDFTWKKPRDPITLQDMREALGAAGASPGPGWYVLIATGWDRAPDEEWLNHPYIEDDAARHLAELGVWGVGLDTPSPDYAPFNVHKILLPKGILIIENLAGLTGLAGRVIDRFIAAPLKIAGGSASPIRALAILD